MAKKKKRPVWVPIVKTVTVLLTLAGLYYAGSQAAEKYVVFAGGRPVLLTSESVDLRDYPVEIEDYEKLAEKIGGDKVLWCVPIGGSYHESNAQYIILEHLTEEEIPYLSYIPNLKTVDATKCPDHAALAALAEARPDLELKWQVHLGSKAFPRNAEIADVTGENLTSAQLEEALPWFEPGTRIVLGKTDLTAEEKTTLREKFPDLTLAWDIQVLGKTFSGGETKLNFAGEQLDVAALVAAADQFVGVEEVDVTGCELSMEELLALQEAFPAALLRTKITVHGMTFATDAEEMDFSGIKMKDTAEVERAAKLMPRLKKVIMCDCGISNEDMDALNQKFPNTQFVWTVTFSVYTLRTDAQAFCASDLPEEGYIAKKLNSEQLQPLKYCTELIALDLGHMYYKDLSFLENMTKLKYLILVDARYTDISVLANMPDLYYLEIFKNEIEDLSPLLECKNLKHLNIGYTRGFDAGVLKEMTWLERLWFPGHGLEAEQKQEIIDALKDTNVYMPGYDTDGSTGGKWREHDVYYEMRNLFDMFYQPGGTGMDN